MVLLMTIFIGISDVVSLKESNSSSKIYGYLLLTTFRIPLYEVSGYQLGTQTTVHFDLIIIIIIIITKTYMTISGKLCPVAAPLI